MKDDGQELTKRLRVGFTGLAAVFLLVMLGAVFVQFVSGGDVPPPNGLSAAASPSDASGNVGDAPQEPLAELGVTPGNAPPAKASPAPSTR